MTNWFYFLALSISGIFLLDFIVMFICAFVIYFNVENTVINKKGKKTKNE